MICAHTINRSCKSKAREAREKGEARAEPIPFQSARSARKGRGASRAAFLRRRAKRAKRARHQLSRKLINIYLFRFQPRIRQIKPFSAKKVNLVRCYNTAPFLDVSSVDSCFFTNAIQSGKWSGSPTGLDEHLPFAQYLHPQVVYKHRAASERTFSAGKGNAVGIADCILRSGRGLGGRGNAHPKAAGGGGGFGGWAVGAPPDADARPPRSG